MKRAAPFAVLIFAAAAALYLLRGKSAPVAAPSSVSVSTGIATATATPVSASASAPPPAANVSPAFVSFLTDDSKLLDSMHVDTAAEEARENETASRMGPAEIDYALAVALSAKAPANLRILSADLLGRVTPPGASAAQDRLITGPSNSARAAPHSVEELSNVQSKAIALMEVDAIADRAAKDPAERDHLLRLETQAADSTIRKHIAERIRGLPSL